MTTVVTHGNNGVPLVFPAVAPASGTSAAQLSLIGVLDQNLSQSFNTQGLPLVKISFDYRIQSLDLGLFFNSPADVLTVSAGNWSTTLKNNDPIFGGYSDTGWKGFTTGYIPASSLGSGNNFTLSFKLDNDDSPELTRVFVDNVSVQAIPEPASLAAFGLMGLTAVGYRLRRRVRAA